MHIPHIDFGGTAGCVAVIATSNPPVNSLSHGTRASLADAIRSLFAIDNIGAVVL